MAVILVVDDDLVIRTILAHALRRSGHTLYTAGSGGQALDVLAHEAVEVLITDFWMPDMSGRSLLHRVASAPARPRIIVVTGDPQALQEGDHHAIVDSVMSKPVNLSDLKAEVMRLCAPATVAPLTPL